MRKMRRKLPKLNALRAFEASGRYLSFTGAANELLVTQGAVSRHVSLLEDWLGLKLLLCPHRGIELTRKGETYIRALSSVFDQVDYATRDARDEADCSVLRLKLPPTFAMRWLVPRLTGFKSLHPKIDIQLVTSHEPANFRREDVDGSVHSHPFPLILLISGFTGQAANEMGDPFLLTSITVVMVGGTNMAGGGRY